MTDERLTPTPPTNAGREFPARALTADEIAALWATIPTRSTSGIRARALVAVMLGAGLRVQEALDLQPSDILDGCLVRVRHGKGDKPRTVGIAPSACDTLARWLDLRPSLGLTRHHPVFAAYSAGDVGNPLDQRYVRRALARYGTKAGIERLHPHALRHTHAYGLAEAGKSVHKIQQQLGHASLATTSRYLAHINPRDLAAMLADVDFTGRAS
jgi:integrase